MSNESQPPGDPPIKPPEGQDEKIRDAGNQSKGAINKFAPTTSIANSEGIQIDWSLIEETARTIGIPATADKFSIDQNTIQTRKKRHKWKGIPDGRSMSKLEIQAREQDDSSPGVFTHRIIAHRERVFNKASESCGRFKVKAPSTFREFKIADDIARRAAGLDDEESQRQSVLITINEQIDDHDGARPIEAHEVQPCAPAPQQLESSDAGKQSTPPPQRAPEVANEIKTSGSLTLNADDSSRRRYVLP